MQYMTFGIIYARLFTNSKIKKQNIETLRHENTNN